MLQGKTVWACHQFDWNRHNTGSVGFKVKQITRVFTLSLPKQSPFAYQILQIAGSRSSRSTGNADVFFRTQATNEALRAFAE